MKKASIFIGLLWLTMISPTTLSQEENIANSQMESNAQSISFSMKKEGDLPSVSRISFALLLVILTAFSIIYLLKKYYYKSQAPSHMAKSIELIESKRVGLKLNIHLIKIENAKYIVAEKGESLTILQQMDNQK